MEGNFRCLFKVSFQHLLLDNEKNLLNISPRTPGVCFVKWNQDFWIRPLFCEVQLTSFGDGRIYFTDTSAGRVKTTREYSCLLISASSIFIKYWSKWPRLLGSFGIGTFESRIRIELGPWFWVRIFRVFLITLCSVCRFSIRDKSRTTFRMICEP
jgi:hypothetical protein